MLRSNMTGNGISLTGKRSWTLNKQTLKFKVKDCLSYFGVFVGVGLVALSSTNLPTYIYVLLLGALITPVTMLVRENWLSTNLVYLDDEGNPEKKSITQSIKKFILYLMSTLGIGLYLGGWLSLFSGEGKNFWILVTLGLLLSLLSRYNLKKHKILGVIEDYSMYVNAYAGVVLIAFGIQQLTTSFILAILLILIGSLVTPFALILREKAIFKRKSKNTKRKFLSIMSVTIGTGCSVIGAISIFNGDWLLSLLVLEGFILMLGGAIVNENRLLVTLKDIL